MRIGVPLFGSDVAPRFCAADRLLLVETDGATVLSESEVSLGDGHIPRRLAEVRALGVERLLCGGFNRRFLPLAAALGVRVRWGLTGDARAAIRDCLAGTPGGTDPPPEACLGPGPWRGRRAGRGGGWGRGFGPRPGPGPR
jgi:hypothetical protein